MLAFVITTLICFITYLSLTTGSGDVVGLWSIEELLFGLILSLIAGFISHATFFKNDTRMLNPVRWIIFLVYLIGPFFIALAKANFDVAYRVFTGKINPGIVKISPDLKTDLGVTMLANSITLTPGTLTVDVDEESKDMYIHWINVDKNMLNKKTLDCSYVCGEFSDWIRRIAE
ncbi:cation:proton antiporter [Thermoplasmatales archaeon ex4572_165]|nr:MAG: cation:proton antiporter [Thermoplasmatales archaeon ex4572_165]